MVKPVQEAVGLPMIGWECGNCDEPYNSRRKPDQHMCMACRRETIWELPEDHILKLYGRLVDASEGDQITVVPERAASMRGTVTDIDEGLIVLDGDSRYIHFSTTWDGDQLLEYTLTMCQEADEDPRLGDDLHYAIVTPEEDVEVDTRATKRVMTPVDELVQGAATSAGLDPDTVEVEGVRMVDGELEFELRGEA